ncbi:hypothetical protein GQ53DRAFT_720225 [Thozetella sp. PMI_491]|nr:hypothetical protein GQ53DRAFT_720225 [Thozetella sp. PMI_491]
MDPFSAIGLASNVLAFVDFAGRLVMHGAEVYTSPSGVTERTAELERVYTDLGLFSLKLEEENGRFRAGSSSKRSLGQLLADADDSSDVASWDRASAQAAAHMPALKALALDCKALCDQLLAILGKLKVDEGQWRALRSFKVALRAVWDKKKIAELEERIGRFRDTISAHFLPILTAQQSMLMKVVDALRQESHELRADQSAGLDRIFTKLHDIEQRILSGREPEDDKITLLSDGMSAMVLTEEALWDVAKTQMILRSLNFNSRPVRHDNIPEAHVHTFRWALELGRDLQHDIPGADGDCVDIDSDDSSTESSVSESHCQSSSSAQLAAGALFNTWLREGDGFFWISGKAGSGKSTLLKLIANNAETRSRLREWAGSMDLVVASHYFWSAGTPMQKSEEGLLRSLLFDIFRAYPSLISRSCPDLWSDSDAKRTAADIEWTTRALRGALQAIASYSDTPVRYCFFIDGIDEFAGDHYEISTTLKALSSSRNIKLCLSGRPWNIFEDFFGQDASRKFYVHDLTFGDIRAFTTSRLTEHGRWNLVAHLNQTEKDALIDEVTSKAKGVFLWVFLVTRSLREGLTNGDTMSDLRERLRSLPQDLESLFRHMLNLIDPIYSAKAAHTLRIAVDAEQPLHFRIYIILDDLSTDPKFALRPADGAMRPSEWDQQRDLCRRQINARCGGLIELKKDSVEFIHRTVRDFLRGREMSDYLETKSYPGFSTRLATLRAYVAYIKRDVIPTPSASWSTAIDQALFYVKDALEDDCNDAYIHLKEMGNSVLGHHRSYFYFRKNILYGGYDKFVSLVMAGSPYYFEDVRPPIDQLLRVELDEQRLSPPHVRIVQSIYPADFEAIKENMDGFRCSAFRKLADLLSEIVDKPNKYEEPQYPALTIISDLIVDWDELDGAFVNSPAQPGNYPAIWADSTRDIDLGSVASKVRGQFWRVAEAVVRYGNQFGWELDPLVPALQELLPKANPNRCRAPRRAKEIWGSKGRKRPAEDEAYGPPAKQPK